VSECWFQEKRKEGRKEDGNNITAASKTTEEEMFGRQKAITIVYSFDTDTMQVTHTIIFILFVSFSLSDKFDIVTVMSLSVTTE